MRACVCVCVCVCALVYVCVRHCLSASMCLTFHVLGPEAWTWPSSRFSRVQCEEHIIMEMLRRNEEALAKLQGGDGDGDASGHVPTGSGDADDPTGSPTLD